MSRGEAWLECDHVVAVATVCLYNFPTEWCRTCHKDVQVTEYITAVWHSRCSVCRYSRTHGQARKYANDAAGAHTARTGHPVTVSFYADRPQGFPTLTPYVTKVTNWEQDEIPF